jgi:predicted ATPase/class 3 adenylate cyclase
VTTDESAGARDIDAHPSDDCAVAGLPSGTVTLLFTDVEGSTKLLDELGPEGYRDALGEHRRLLREAFARHGGYEVDYEGDAFFVAFQQAREAVAAAQESQAALAGGPIRVRMGLHTGEPILDPPKYVGHAVHLAARVMSAGHGGQVLLSQATRELIELDVTELGEHRLKDFAEPMSLYQLGSESFPPLKTISNTNLPRPASRFVGRDREVAEVVSLVREGARLVTLTGPGGSGKTRLAIEAAGELVPEFKAGVFWVGLAALRDHALVLETVAQTLGAKEALRDHIGDRELLLLLDNLEQVVEAAPELAALVEACPNLRLLVTSRELLRVRGEVEYQVLPLAEAEAVQLFCGRAQVEPGPAVEELCRRLDNMPLALELAGARARVLTIEQLLERLSTRLDLFRGGRDADPRQQTLRATIEWSYDLLSEEEQALFARLATFAGGCELEAAEQVADADVETLQSLVDKSLVRRTNDRFWMLETIREFALERLDESQDAVALRARHARFLLAFAEEAKSHLAGERQGEWLGRIADERDNIRVVLAWALDAGEELALRLAAALRRFWWVRAYAEGLAWLRRGLAEIAADPEVRADALDAAGGTAYFAGDDEAAVTYFREGLAIFRELGDQAGAARMLRGLGPPLMRLGRMEEAERVVRDAVAINRELDDKEELALGLEILGSAVASRGQLGEARELYEEALALARAIGDHWSLAYTLQNLAELALEEGDPDRAWRLGCEAILEAQRIGDQFLGAFCLAILSVAAARREDEGRAGALWGAAERLGEELGTSAWDGPDGRALYEEMLGPRGATFKEAVPAGRRLTLAEAIQCAVDS